MTRLLRILLIAVIWFCCATGIATAAPPRAQPSTPSGSTGARITITLTSDSQNNRMVSWTDSTGAPRTQESPSLTTLDRTTGIWTSTLTYTGADTLHDLAVVFQTSGAVAGCRITAGGRTLSDERSHGRRAIAICRASR